MKKILIFSLTAILISSSVALFSFGKKKKSKPFRVMFYNVENLFDTEDDPKIDDQDFLPEGELKWNKERLETKYKHIAQVINALGKSQMPDIVGFAEIENRKVLDELITQTDLNSKGYSIVHFDSPDKRGIDVGFIYQKDRFKLLKSMNYPVIFPGDMEKPTRDILYVKGNIYGKTTLHVLVNHWPSRSGGQVETEEKRIMAAKTARRLCDSIQGSDANANIVLIGDFNDYPTDKSITQALGAESDTTKKGSKLFNLMAWQNSKEHGSHQYKGEWGFLDQIILSSAVMEGKANLHTYFKSAKVFKPDFVLEKNEKYGTMQPFRTYGGKKYLGGYSDHMPVYVDLYTK
jgi:predicted extracellular nuclease